MGDDLEDEFVRRGMSVLADLKKGDPQARKRLQQLFPELEKAAESGHVEAQALAAGFALDYLNDPPTALKFFQRAADAGNAAAQRGLGYMLVNGVGVERDLPRAAGLFQSAAESGDAVAAFNLGNLLLNGQGVTKDEQCALSLLKDAKDGGVAHAGLRLGDWHAERGEERLARECYLDAAEGGVPVAMLKAGSYCREGVGGNIDRVQAVRWYLRALDFGNGDGVHDAIATARLMSDTEVREAARLAGREPDAEALLKAARKQ
ncbi:tetratricopeptide repeat protein [Actinomadura sp. 3N508]|uniref:tetratricopeptide repeat protein n=1 Tax=Actinomadura sp. 3N508 TaxID=3375153 RepID=UPI0037BD2C7E